MPTVQNTPKRLGRQIIKDVDLDGQSSAWCVPAKYHRYFPKTNHMWLLVGLH